MAWSSGPPGHRSGRWSARLTRSGAPPPITRGVRCSSRCSALRMSLSRRSGATRVLDRLRARPDLERLAPLLADVLPLDLAPDEVVGQLRRAGTGRQPASAARGCPPDGGSRAAATDRARGCPLVRLGLMGAGLARRPADPPRAPGAGPASPARSRPRVRAAPGRAWSSAAPTRTPAGSRCHRAGCAAARGELGSEAGRRAHRRARRWEPVLQRGAGLRAA